MHITKKIFGQTKYNEPVFIYQLRNSNDSYVEILNYGCRIHSICVHDKNHNLRDVCLGYDSISDYETDDAFFGAVVGRCANLISESCFTLNGVTYQLDKNDGPHHLHGGKNGFSFHLWNGTIEDKKLVFTHQASDKVDGYPGNLNIKVSYEWTDENQLHIIYEAVSNQDTILNVTNHTYFNLEGPQNASIMEHKLCIDANMIAEINQQLLPTGRLLPIEGTPFDFRVPKSLKTDFFKEHTQLIFGNGYDHNFVLNGNGFRKVATLQSAASGIRMNCYTDRPCMQIYTANGLESRIGKDGETLSPHSGICLETQHYTNAINIPSFPSVILGANEVFYSKTTYAFDTISE